MKYYFYSNKTWNNFLLSPTYKISKTFLFTSSSPFPSIKQEPLVFNISPDYPAVYSTLQIVCQIKIFMFISLALFINVKHTAYIQFHEIFHEVQCFYVYMYFVCLKVVIINTLMFTIQNTSIHILDHYSNRSQEEGLAWQISERFFFQFGFRILILNFTR